MRGVTFCYFGEGDSWAAAEVMNMVNDMLYGIAILPLGRVVPFSGLLLRIGRPCLFVLDAIRPPPGIKDIDLTKRQDRLVRSATAS